MVPSSTSYVYISKPSSLLRIVQHLQQYPRLAIDLETYCRPEYRQQVPREFWALDPHSGGISLLTVCGDDTVPYVIDILRLENTADLTPLVELLKTREYLVAHNAKFEIKHLYQQFGHWFENFRCTEVMATLIGNASGSKYGRSRGYSLAALLRDWFNLSIEGKGVEQVSDWLPRPEGRKSEEWERKLAYAAADVRYLLPLHDCLYAVLTQPLPDPKTVANTPPCALGYAQGNVFELEMQMLVVSAQIEYWGLPCNFKLFEEFEQIITDPIYGGGEMIRVASEILEELGFKGIPSPYHDYCLPYPEQLRQLNNPKQLQKLIEKYVNSRLQESSFHLENAQRTTIQRLVEVAKAYAQAEDEEVKVQYIDDEERAAFEFILELAKESLEDTCELAAKILEYKKLQKQAGMKLSGYIHPLTGCIHSSFRQSYAATGRSASSNPNAQNINNRLRVPIELTAEKLRNSAARF